MRSAKILNSLETLKQIDVPITAIIDVGIQHETPVLMKVFHSLHHILFEPINDYFPFIKENYKHLSYDLIEAAVSDIDGEIIIHSERKTRGNEISHSYIVNKPTNSSRNIKSITLDTYFSQNPIEDNYLLKIDVEGANVPSQILNGSKDILSKASVVVIEMTVDRFMERAIILDQAGFDLWDLCDLCYYGDCLWQTDAIFVRRDIKNRNDSLKPMHNKPFKPELWQSGF